MMDELNPDVLHLPKRSFLLKDIAQWYVAKLASLTVAGAA